MKIVRMLTSGFIFFCIGTVIAQLVLLSVLWLKGNLAKDRVYRLMAAFHNVDIAAIKDVIRQENKPTESEQDSFETRQVVQVNKAMDLALRSTAIDKGLGDLYGLTIKLNQVKARYETILKGFETRLDQLESGINDKALEEVQRIFEVISPKQAKDQILKMIDDGSMYHVVHIMKSMSLEKRKKLITEFKEKDEPEKLHDILRLIRLGVPKMILIETTRKELRKINQ